MPSPSAGRGPAGPAGPVAPVNPIGPAGPVGPMDVIVMSSRAVWPVSSFSLLSSSTLAPEELSAKYVIYVDDDGGKKVEKYTPYADTCRKIDEITDSLAVEKGTAILFLVNPKPEFYAGYKKELAKKLLE